MTKSPPAEYFKIQCRDLICNARIIKAVRYKGAELYDFPGVFFFSFCVKQHNSDYVAKGIFKRYKLSNIRKREDDEKRY